MPEHRHEGMGTLVEGSAWSGGGGDAGKVPGRGGTGSCGGKLKWCPQSSHFRAT